MRSGKLLQTGLTAAVLLMLVLLLFAAVMHSDCHDSHCLICAVREQCCHLAQVSICRSVLLSGFIGVCVLPGAEQDILLWKKTPVTACVRMND